MTADASNTGSFLQASTTIDSALFFVFAAFILNVIVVIIAFCYFDPAPHEPALVYRTYHTLRRLSRRNAEARIRMSIKSEEEESNDSPAQCNSWSTTTL
ncbi:unnamed protein product [Caenorhabditis angaria]|uniref:Uncharacterized protein n=1 Tax=Caenorhabditis angaria TaxID=860376 RepID=A0A9P1I9D9_9PELO|nr:unnamed protein product [Caenorhabditis angaria]